MTPILPRKARNDATFRGKAGNGHRVRLRSAGKPLNAAIDAVATACGESGKTLAPGFFEAGAEKCHQYCHADSDPVVGAGEAPRTPAAVGYYVILGVLEARRRRAMQARAAARRTRRAA